MRRWLIGTCLVLCLGLWIILGYLIFPVPQLRVPVAVSLSAQDIVIQRKGELTAPAYAWSGDPVRIRFVLEPVIPDESQDNILAEARLEVSGSPAQSLEILEPLVAGQPVSFDWEVDAGEDATWQGKLWLAYRTSSGVRHVVLIRPVQFSVRKPLGVSGEILRYLSITGAIALSLLFSLTLRKLKKN